MPETLALVPLHATPSDQPPPLTPARLLSVWDPNPVVIIVLLLVAGAYGWGVVRLHRRGDRWPVRRTVGFMTGVASAGVAILSALGSYDTVLISVHMAQHMILAMITPLFLALGAPVTLALRTLPRTPRSVLLAILHSRLAKVITFPVLVIAVYVANPWVLYYTPLYEATLRNPVLHDLLHLHFLVVGCLFFWPLVGPDPVPGKVTHPLRLLMLLITLPFHAFLGLTIMSSPSLIAESWYLAFGRSWPPTPVDDQYLAGAILWASGDTVSLIQILILFAQWVKHSRAEGVREDRRLDRLEAASRGASSDDAAADEERAEDDPVAAGTEP